MKILSLLALSVVSTGQECFGFHQPVIFLHSDLHKVAMVLQMGGYYSEPQQLQPKAPHMVFGSRCVEESILLPDHSTIKAFYPVHNRKDDDDGEPDFQTPYAMIDHLIEHSDTLVRGQRVLEIGASGLSLVLAAACGSGCEPTSITAFSDDEKRLQLLEPAASKVLNPLTKFRTPIQTHVWNGYFALPEADVICITHPKVLSDEYLRHFLEQLKGVTFVHYDQQQTTLDGFPAPNLVMVRSQ